MLENKFLHTAIDYAVMLSGGSWVRANHLEYINSKLSYAISAGNKKVIINLPPRHGKSEFISKYLPFWYLSNFKEKQIIFTTYDQQFANTWGRKVRDLVREYGVHYEIRLRKDVYAVEHFELESGGGMTSVGAGGSLTGRGADLLIIDDPIKNDVEANSFTHREAVWNWFNSTAFTRIEPGGTVILVMTRWHEDDICGRIIKRQTSRNAAISSQISSSKPVAASFMDWEVISIPAIAEENDVLERVVGEPLWAARYDLDKLNEIKAQIGERWFSALYQQRPSLAIGNIFKRKTFQYFDEDEHYYYLSSGREVSSIQFSVEDGHRLGISPHFKVDCSIFAVMDLAATARQTSDYTAIIVFAVNRKQDILILDVIREKFEGSEHLPLLRAVYSRWHPILIGIESVQYQISLIQMARKENIPVKELKPDKDKVSRALPIATLLEAGKIYFREGASWLAAFEEELLSFPKGRYDDQVDAFAYITSMLRPVLASQSDFQYVVSHKNRIALGF